MQTVNIEMRPRDSKNTTVNKVTNSKSFKITGVIADTYDYTIISDSYDTVTGTVIVDGSKAVNIALNDTVVGPSVTWVSKTRARAIPYTTETIEDPAKLPSEGGITQAGENGSEYQTYEQKYINGMPVSEERNLSGWTVTKVAKKQIVVVGTKVGELVNLLNNSNVFSAGSNNLLVGGVETEEPFNINFQEVFKWESDGRIRWFMAMVQAHQTYTIAFKIRKKTGTFNKIGGYLGDAWKNAITKVYKDGVEVANAWDLYAGGVPLSNVTTTQTYVLHLTTTGDVGAMNEFTIQPNLMASDLLTYYIESISLYEGHVQPFN